MSENPKIDKIAVRGLHGTYDYEVAFPETGEPVILIAPNGYGKTAFLSLINYCLSLDLRRAAKIVFDILNITFVDGSRWRFVRKISEGSERASDRAAYIKKRNRYRGYREAYAGPHWVDLTRFDQSGERIAEEQPDMSSIDRRALASNIERFEPWLFHASEPNLFQASSRSSGQMEEAFSRYFALINQDDDIRRAVTLSLPSFVWPNISKIETVFIETQRLLYEYESREDREPGPKHKEEILRQSEKLSSLLSESYGEYASTSQSLDRTFPSRLIERAREANRVDEHQLKENLAEIEQKRRELTNVGILVEQAATLASLDDDLVAQVLFALQIYVEDSKKKLAIYDDLFPKLEVFSELVGKKLDPKVLSISREKGATLSRGEDELSLSSLSSGEKHEFIMLFRLAFETTKNSLVLIDEPEISLHVVWQMEFMTDLTRLQAANPFQCIIATHSPQIFQAHRHLVVDLADQIK